MAGEGHEAAALKQLVPALNQAIADGDLTWISMLARNAAIFAEHLRNPNEAAGYLELSLTHNPDDPLVLYQLGNLCLEQGDTDRASQLFTTCRMVCEKRGDSGQIIELLG
jgi:Tfp pilus assembly protein PilF